MELRKDLFYKSSPKQNLKNLFKKISEKELDEMPQINDAFHPSKKAFIYGIQKDSKPEYIRLNKQMNYSDIKMYKKINDLKELVYEINKEEHKEDLNNISKENELFEKNYKKIKKDKNKLNRGNYLDYPQFLNISSQYVTKNTKVPNLSDEHNLFSGSPLILQGTELKDYIVYYFGKRVKGIKYLKKLKAYVEKKIETNNKIDNNEKEKLEELIKKEKPKGYIPPEEEINILKNDISNSEQTYKNLIEIEEFFKPRKKKLKIIKSLIRQNNRSFNISTEQSPLKNFVWRITSNFNNEYRNQSNSLNTATTSINMTRKSSPKNSNNINSFNLKSLQRDFHLKLPKLDSSIRSPSNIFNINNSYKNNKKLKIKKINFNRSLKIDSNSISRNNKPFQIFKSFYFKEKKSYRRLYNIEPNNKIYKLLQLSNIYSNNDNKKDNYFSVESDVSDIIELNKEIRENNKKMEENKFYENTKTNLDDSIKIKEQKIFSKINNINNNKLKNINISNPNIQKPEEKNNINENEKENKSFDENYNKVESLFNLIKNKTNNNLEKETKKDIESYIGSKGKNVETILTTKSSYNRLHRLINNSKNKKLILEDYAMRKNKYNINDSFSNKQRIILDKNLGFIKEMIKQKTKFNEMLFRDKSK